MPHGQWSLRFMNISRVSAQSSLSHFAHIRVRRLSHGLDRFSMFVCHKSLTICDFFFNHKCFIFWADPTGVEGVELFMHLVIPVSGWLWYFRLIRMTCAFWILPFLSLFAFNHWCGFYLFNLSSADRSMFHGLRGIVVDGCPYGRNFLLNGELVNIFNFWIIEVAMCLEQHFIETLDFEIFLDIRQNLHRIVGLRKALCGLLEQLSSLLWVIERFYGALVSQFVNILKKVWNCFLLFLIKLKFIGSCLVFFLKNGLLMLDQTVLSFLGSLDYIIENVSDGVRVWD